MHAHILSPTRPHSSPPGSLTVSILKATLQSPPGSASLAWCRYPMMPKSWCGRGLPKRMASHRSPGQHPPPTPSAVMTPRSQGSAVTGCDQCCPKATAGGLEPSAAPLPQRLPEPTAMGRFWGASTTSCHDSECQHLHATCQTLFYLQLQPKLAVISHCMNEETEA